MAGPAPASGTACAALAAEAEAALAARLDALAPSRLGVAVSGGGDSVALLLAAADWRARRPGACLRAVTFDHRLRPEAEAEARAVAALCARLGVPHETLRWRAPARSGNLSAAARDARAGAIADWAARHALGAVALGHTLDDQAETLLMRLARGSGLDGLAAMREVSRRLGGVWIRPALGLRRDALRAMLRSRGESWIDDPSNDDPARDRAKARRALAALAPLGVGAAGLAATAGRLADDSDLLGALAQELLARTARIGGAGEVALDRAAWREAPPGLARRALGRLVRGLAGARHPPRRAALDALLAALRAAGDVPARTLHGCMFEARGPEARLWREPAAAARADPDGAPWDGRWTLAWPGEAPADLTAGPLGEDGLARLRALRAAGEWAAPPAFAAAPRAARAASPALRRRGALAAAPLAGYGSATAEDALARLLAAPGAPSGHGPAR